jgi:hypothetical protein
MLELRGFIPDEPADTQTGAEDGASVLVCS